MRPSRSPPDQQGLAVAANHWHNLVHCDGSIEVVGCQGDASYTAALFVGACVSACEASCPQGDTDRGQCCECWCKDEGRESGNAACQPQDLCYTGSDGHAVYLASQQP